MAADTLVLGSWTQDTTSTEKFPSRGLQRVLYPCTR